MPDMLKPYLDQMGDRLNRIETKLDSLNEFKVSTIGMARLTSFIVSGILGFLSMVASGIVTYVVTLHYLPAK